MYYVILDHKSTEPSVLCDASGIIKEFGSIREANSNGELAKYNLDCKEYIVVQTAN